MPDCTILYFAQLRDRLGLESERYPLPAQGDAAALLALVVARHPAAAAIVARCRVAVDHQFVAGPCALTPISEIALIPPVSGG
jgi:molybdopterin converting factor subunit 1